MFKKKKPKIVCKIEWTESGYSYKKYLKTSSFDEKEYKSESSTIISNDIDELKNLLTGEPIDTECISSHNENARYDVSGASRKLGELLAIGEKNSYNKFICKDANNAHIPQKARDIYKLTRNWDPKWYPNDYVECVSFVFMSYNMAKLE